MKTNTFGKIAALIVCLLIPTVTLYLYSYTVSVDVVTRTMKENNLNQLSFFMSQMDMQVNQLTKFSRAVSRDFSLREYLDGHHGNDSIKKLQSHVRIREMLNMQTTTSVWNNQIILYLGDTEEVISTDYSAVYDEDFIRNTPLNEWFNRSAVSFGITQSFFSRLQATEIPNLWIEVRFTEDNIRNMLSRLNQTNRSEPFFYRQGEDPIVSYTVNPMIVEKAVQSLESMKLGRIGHAEVTLNGQPYIINYVRSDSLGWYLVDVIPLQTIFSPITTSRNLFIASVILLIVLSLSAALLLYRNVQRPIRLLIQGVRRIGRGDYSVRIRKQANNEFDYLIYSFNQMAEKIERLIDTVYKEQLRSKEATLKQLQSQINPHFLYNCMFYIQNMAKLGDQNAVVAMALNLGEYYRYMTRTDQMNTTIREEIRHVENYLRIQSLRMSRFHYEIDIPEEMMDIEIPRLIIQPVVENAVIHGIEPNLNFGLILIRGERSDGTNRIVVEDNGVGMTEEQIDELRRKVTASTEGKEGFGLWNTHQRLVHRYKEGSGMRIASSSLGGLRVELVWKD